MTAYPHARAGEVAELVLPETDEPGRYSALAEMRREGVLGHHAARHAGRDGVPTRRKDVRPGRI